MSIPWALAIPVIIFVGVIIPLAITFHYVTVWLRMRQTPGASTTEREEMARLADTAHKLEQRLESLETILDAEVPNWRNK